MYFIYANTVVSKMSLIFNFYILLCKQNTFPQFFILFFIGMFRKKKNKNINFQ